MPTKDEAKAIKSVLDGVGELHIGLDPAYKYVKVSTLLQQRHNVTGATYMAVPGALNGVQDFRFSIHTSGAW
jgi:hypothetical protein